MVANAKSVAGTKPRSTSKIERVGVAPDLVRVGKDVIELLTSGMYLSPLTVFREYIQNAADGIDAKRRHLSKSDPAYQGLVKVEIDHAARGVVIRDNGAALKAEEALAVLVAIGGSPKRGTAARGFRGVGRLSGLAYCRELEFRSKAEGEKVIACVSWDCRELRRRLADGTTKDDLKSIVAASVTTWFEDADDRSDHFFEVTMHDVARHRQDLLLNEQLIAQYLGQVAPIAFSPEFSFGPSIDERLAATGVSRNPIRLDINGEPVYRPFRDKTLLPSSSHHVQLGEIEFFELADVDGAVGAVGWVAHHEYVRGLPAALGVRGLRARVGDVQVGDANLFEGAFREPRFNGWTIGEIHVLDRRIVPNGRRDDFEVNHHAYNMIAQIGPIAARIALRCRTASVGRNAEQTILGALLEAEQRIMRPAALEDPELDRFRGSLQRASGKLKAVPDAERRKHLETDLSRVNGLLVERRAPIPPTLDAAKAVVNRIVTNRQQAKALISELRRLFSDKA